MTNASESIISNIDFACADEQKKHINELSKMCDHIIDTLPHGVIHINLISQLEKIKNGLQQLNNTFVNESTPSDETLYKNTVIATGTEIISLKVNKIMNQYNVIGSGGINYPQEVYPPQRGEHCKIYALSIIHNYHCRENSRPPFPLLAQGTQQKSIRNIAKSFGSRQGEILEYDILKKIGVYIGYHVTVFKANNLDAYINELSKPYKNRGIIAFYCVNKEDHQNLETQEMTKESYEHATAVSSYDSGKRTVTLNHWQNAFYDIPVEDLFNSSMLLPETRNQEMYLKNASCRLRNPIQFFAERRKKYKYISYSAAIDKDNTGDEIIRTIKPKKGTGFRGLLMIFEPDANHQQWTAVFDADRSGT